MAIESRAEVSQGINNDADAVGVAVSGFNFT